jgi:NAD(P)-dependent dehydrogenase (short-subunit alcohol dehydrogenase family)
VNWSATRRLVLSDVEKFGAISGDRNPIHVDPVLARRMIFNRAIVHGVLLVLLVLEDIIRESALGAIEIMDLHALFRRPVSVGDAALFEINGEWPKFHFSILSSRSPSTTGTVTFRDRREGWGKLRLRANERIPVADIDEDEIENAVGHDYLTNPDELEDSLPNVCSAIPAEQISALLALTRIIGMRCPGLRSVLSEVTLKAPATGDRIDWKVPEYDRRFARVELVMSGSGYAMNGVSFVQPRSRPGVSVGELRDLILPGEFARRNAVVIGGSRGLGAAFVRLLALGGAQIVATYRAEAAEAAAIKAELGDAGAGVRYQKLDLDIAEQLPTNLVNAEVSDLFYCASPPIFVGSKGVIASELFDDFNRIYVSAFLKSFEQIRERCPYLRYVFYPSSGVLDDPQPNLVEYAMSKIAAEELVRALASKYRKIRFHCVRIPRLDTDQTITLSNVKGMAPSIAALQILRNKTVTPQ